MRLNISFAAFMLTLQYAVDGTETDGNKVVGGTPASLDEFPYQLLLYISQKGTTYLCGGSIVTLTYAITAAHCLNLKGSLNVTLKVGLNNMQSPSATSYTRQASNIRIHPSYNSRTNDNDLALIQVDPPFDNVPQSQPILLPRDASDCTGVATVTGFGTTAEGGSLSNTLMKAQVPIMTADQCTQYLGKSVNSSTMICAGYPQGGVDTCQGDSGGPLAVTVQGNVNVLCGITSFGNGCARPNQPGVYTRVSTYINWIYQNTAGPS